MKNTELHNGGASDHAASTGIARETGNQNGQVTTQLAGALRCLPEAEDPDPECFEEVAQQPALHANPTSINTQGSAYRSSTGRGFVAITSCNRLLRAKVGDDVGMKVFKTVDDVEKGLSQYCYLCGCHNYDITMSDMEPIPGCWKYEDGWETERLRQKFGEAAFKRLNGDLAKASKGKILATEEDGELVHPEDDPEIRDWDDEEW